MGHTMHMSEPQVKKQWIRDVLGVPDDSDIADVYRTPSQASYLAELEASTSAAKDRRDVSDGQLNLFDDGINGLISSRLYLQRITSTPDFPIALEKLKAMTPKPPATTVRN